MKKLFVFFLGLLLVQGLFAQEWSNKGYYKVWVELDYSRMYGTIYQLQDSAILIGDLEWLKSGEEIPYRIIPVNAIDQINVRKKGSVGRGILIGAAAGFATGAILGLAEGDDAESSGWNFFSMTAEEKALGYGVLLAVPGSILGGLIGSTKIKIPLNRNLDTYQAQREKLKRYTLKF